jgi:DNA primase
MFDADDGGKKALDLARKRAILNYDFISLPSGYDPNEYIIQYGKDDIQKAIDWVLTTKDVDFCERHKETMQGSSNISWKVLSIF